MPRFPNRRTGFRRQETMQKKTSLERMIIHAYNDPVMLHPQVYPFSGRIGKGAMPWADSFFDDSRC